MPDRKIEHLKAVNDFKSLIEYLRDELLWPIELEDADDITFDYNPKDLGIEERYAAKIRTIKQIRPFTDTQPWGIFFIEFEPKKLPVVVMRRILRALIHTRRGYDDRSPTWNLHDLMLISSLGEEEERKISFAHFTESERGLPELRTFSWDTSDTYFHYLQNKLDLEKLRWPKDDQDIKSWHDQWSFAFTRRHREVIRTSQQLAVEMARLAAQIRDQIKIIYEYEISNGPLHKLFSNFKSVLIHDLDINNFADMYAQTIAYGLFSARVTHEGEFIVEDISAMIPNTNPFLKKLFEECTNIGKSYKEDNLDLDEIGVTELIKTLKESNIEAVLQDFGRQKRGEDPVVHFYELFLREYDAEQKVKRGVFYTPDPVVSFIVRSVDYILKKEFDCPDGLADTSKTQVKKIRPKKKGNGYIEEDKLVSKVQILDPAVGTGTFLKHVIDVIKKTFDENHDNLNDKELKEKWNLYVINSLLPRVFGFELMMAPFAVCHLKLGVELAETGYDFKSDKRLGVYLTNTLEGTHKGAGTLDAYLSFLAEESHKANMIKAKNPINVVIGNPPYSVSSSNKGHWIEKLMVDYKKNLKERNIQPLSDDYIKFIRFAHYMISKNKEGIIAFITNNAYLDSIIHRRMRESLLEDFNKIYVIDLHGSSEMELHQIDGVDENVFDIKQGVSISILIKKTDNESKCEVFRYDLYGKREEKYKFLLETNINEIKWLKIMPKASRFDFLNKDEDIEREYENGYSLEEIFNERTTGIKTSKDALTIHFNKENIIKIIKDFQNFDKDKLKEKYKLIDKEGWRIDNVVEDVKRIKDINPIKICYRPFDIRYTIYTGRSAGFMERPRPKIMNYMILGNNITLVSARNTKHFSTSHFFITDKITELKLGESTRGSYIFPLYKFHKNKSNLISKELNINYTFIKEVEDILNIEFVEGEKSKDCSRFFNEIDLIDVIYSILYSQNFRKKYKIFLSSNFPKIPIPNNKKLFFRLAEKGAELRKIHLFINGNRSDLVIDFPALGTNSVEKIKYKNNKVFINDTQFFNGVSNSIWEFFIAGYKPAKKWLKDRKGRKLTKEDIEHYQKIILAINGTIKIMKDIDEVIEEHGGWPIK